LSGAKANQKKSGVSSKSVFSISPTRQHRHLQEVELYSKLYYDNRIAPAVGDRIKACGKDGSHSIQMIREVTRELYEGEVKAAVRAKMVSVGDASAEDDPNNNSPSPRTPQQYHE
jgi:hypothetical protein